MTKMTIEIPDAQYRKIKIAATNLGISIKDYVLEAVNLKQKILIRDDGAVRILNKKTIQALDESRNKKNKLLSFNSSKEAFAYLDKKFSKN
ncbi:MAG: hypothetical protein SFV53_03840 [Rickettsiales bacterium]|nr:hypothetical protein [Rickettsiales bacterium]